MKKIVAALILFSVFSCKTTGLLKEKDDYVYIVQKSYGGNDTASHAIIDNNNDLIKSIENLNLTEIQDKSLINNIDFEKNVVLIAHMGQKNTGGYAIGIGSITAEKEDVLRVKLKETKPEKGSNVTMALTYPFFIAVIPKAETIIIE